VMCKVYLTCTHWIVHLEMSLNPFKVNVMFLWERNLTVINYLYRFLSETGSSFI